MIIRTYEYNVSSDTIYFTKGDFNMSSLASLILAVMKGEPPLSG